MLARLPTFTGTIERWLKAGSIDMGTWSASEAGTPQGGIISPLAANVALDGMERLFGCEDRDGNPVKAVTKKGMDKSVVLIRYADDFLVTAPSQEILGQHVLPSIEAFLAERGLVLNREKTRIVSIDEGFNFLGFTARKFRNGKLLITPEKDKVLAHLRRIKAYLEPEQAGSRRQGRAGSGPGHPGLDRVLPPRLLGPNLPVCRPPSLADAVGVGQAAAPDEKQGMGQGPLLQADPLAGVELRGCIVPGSAILPWHSDTRIVRHTKVKGRASPLDPDTRLYWDERRRKRLEARSLSKRRQELLRTQGYACTACGVPFDPDEDVGMMDGHHVKPRHKGGGDDTGNLRLLHRWCHHRHHQQIGYKTAEA